MGFTHPFQPSPSSNLFQEARASVARLVRWGRRWRYDWRRRRRKWWWWWSNRRRHDRVRWNHLLNSGVITIAILVQPTPFSAIEDDSKSAGGGGSSSCSLGVDIFILFALLYLSEILTCLLTDLTVRAIFGLGIKSFTWILWMQHEREIFLYLSGRLGRYAELAWLLWSVTLVSVRV